MKNKEVRPCGYCGKEWADHEGAEYYLEGDAAFCFHVKSNNPTATYVPMDNLTYIEYLAKKKNLV